MIPDGFRILLTFDNDKKLFIAHVPELDGLKAEGATRGESLSKAEEAIEQAFRQAAEEGRDMPVPFDNQEFSGELNLKISPSLHRDISFLAKQENITPDQLASELLSAGVSIRTAGRRRERPHHRDEEGPHRGGDDRKRSPRGDRYFNIMDDKAAFIEYVRGLEGGGTPRRRGGRGDR
jgi:predicted RNase H-like HicB family nuclease